MVNLIVIMIVIAIAVLIAIILSIISLVHSGKKGDEGPAGKCPGSCLTSTSPDFLLTQKQAKATANVDTCAGFKCKTGTLVPNPENILVARYPEKTKQNICCLKTCEGQDQDKDSKYCTDDHTANWLGRYPIDWTYYDPETADTPKQYFTSKMNKCCEKVEPGKCVIGCPPYSRKDGEKIVTKNMCAPGDTANWQKYEDFAKSNCKKNDPQIKDGIDKCYNLYAQQAVVGKWCNNLTSQNDCENNKFENNSLCHWDTTTTKNPQCRPICSISKEWTQANNLPSGNDPKIPPTIYYPANAVNPSSKYNAPLVPYNYYKKFQQGLGSQGSRNKCCISTITPPS